MEAAEVAGLRVVQEVPAPRLDPRANGAVVRRGAEGAEEIQRLVGKGVVEGLRGGMRGPEELAFSSRIYGMSPTRYLPLTYTTKALSFFQREKKEREDG